MKVAWSSKYPHCKLSRCQITLTACCRGSLLHVVKMSKRSPLHVVKVTRTQDINTACCQNVKDPYYMFWRCRGSRIAFCMFSKISWCCCECHFKIFCNKKCFKTRALKKISTSNYLLHVLVYSLKCDLWISYYLDSWYSFVVNLNQPTVGLLSTSSIRDIPELPRSELQRIYTLLVYIYVNTVTLAIFRPSQP